MTKYWMKGLCKEDRDNVCFNIGVAMRGFDEAKENKDMPKQIYWRLMLNRWQHNPKMMLLAGAGAA